MSKGRRDLQRLAKTRKLRRRFLRVMRAGRIGPSRRRRAEKMFKRLKVHREAFWQFWCAPRAPGKKMIEVDYGDHS